MNLSTINIHEYVELVREKISLANINDAFKNVTEHILETDDLSENLIESLSELIFVLPKEEQLSLINVIKGRNEIFTHVSFRGHVKLLLEVGQINEFKQVVRLIKSSALRKRKLPLLKIIDELEREVDYREDERRDFRTEILDTNEIVRALSFISDEWKFDQKLLMRYLEFQVDHFYLREEKSLMTELYELTVLLHSELDALKLKEISKVTTKLTRQDDHRDNSHEERRGIHALPELKQAGQGVLELVASIKQMDKDLLFERRDEVLALLMECEEYSFLDQLIKNFQNQTTDIKELINLAYVEAYSLIERGEFLKAMDIIDYWVEGDRLTNEENAAFRKLSFRRR